MKEIKATITRRNIQATIRGAIIKGEQGEQGLQGEVDYNLVNAEIQRLVDDFISQIDLEALRGKDGLDGQNGLDGLNGIDGKDAELDYNFVKKELQRLFQEYKPTILQSNKLLKRNAQSNQYNLDKEFVSKEIKRIFNSWKKDLGNLKGEKGDKGEKGERGAYGPQGPAGQGIIGGGTTGQVLTKKSNTSYDLEWKTPTGGGGGGSVAWGGITGTLSDQTDLQTALNNKQDSLGFTPENVANKENTTIDTSTTKYPTVNLLKTGLDTKEPTITAGTASQYYRGDKTFQTLDKTAVGLSNVDNTSDANKPISTATQTALDGKQPIATVLTNTTASFTTAQETKLAGIQAGAEVNVNADWNAVSGDAQILNKPSIPTQYTDELAQDAVGTILTDTTSIDLIYDDNGNTIYAQREALTGAITASKNSNTTTLGTFTVSQLNTALSDGDVATGGGTATGTNTGDQNIFSTIAVAGQSNVIADSTSDTLTLVAGSNITLTTNATNDEITIASTGGGGGGGGGSSTPPTVTTLTNTTNTLTVGDISKIIRIDTTSNNVTATLPTAVGNTGYIFWIKRISGGSNVATIDTTSSQTIDGQSTAVLTVQYEAIGLYSNGTNWEII